MRQTRTIIGILALVILIGGAIIFATRTDSNDSTIQPKPEDPVVGPTAHDPWTLRPGSTSSGTSTDTTGGSTNNSSSSTAANTYTMSQVAQHNSTDSCWTVIRGGVFDLTTWINRHPGGPQAILSICGVDGTTAFDNQHEGQGRPEQILASYKIGTLQ